MDCWFNGCHSPPSQPHLPRPWPSAASGTQCLETSVNSCHDRLSPQALNATSQKSKVRHNKTKSHQQAHSSSKRHSTALYAALFYSSSILPQKSQFSTPPMIVSLVRIKMGKNFAQVQIDSIITILLHTLI